MHFDPRLGHTPMLLLGPQWGCVGAITQIDVSLSHPSLSLCLLFSLSLYKYTLGQGLKKEDRLKRRLKLCESRAHCPQKKVFPLGSQRCFTLWGATVCTCSIYLWVSASSGCRGVGLASLWTFSESSCLRSWTSSLSSLVPGGLSPDGGWLSPAGPTTAACLLYAVSDRSPLPDFHL